MSVRTASELELLRVHPPLKQLTLHSLAKHFMLHPPPKQSCSHFETFEEQVIRQRPPLHSWMHSLAPDGHFNSQSPFRQSCRHFSASHLELHPPWTQVWLHCFTLPKQATLHYFPQMQNWLNVSALLLALQPPLVQSWMHSLVPDGHFNSQSPLPQSCRHFSALHLELHPPWTQVWLHCFALPKQATSQFPQGHNWLSVSALLIALQSPYVQSWRQSLTDGEQVRSHFPHTQFWLHDLVVTLHTPPMQVLLSQAPKHSCTNPMPIGNKSITIFVMVSKKRRVWLVIVKVPMTRNFLLSYSKELLKWWRMAFILL